MFQKNKIFLIKLIRDNGEVLVQKAKMESRVRRYEWKKELKENKDISIIFTYI